MDNNIKLTEELFEASKILAPAISRGRASLYFDGYGIRKSLQIIGSSRAGQSPCIRIRLDIELVKTVHQFPLLKYMNLKWSDMKELLHDLEEPIWFDVPQEPIKEVKMLDIEFTTPEEGIEKLKKAVEIRNKMGGDLYWNICEDDCLKLADKLTAAGVDKQIIASIGGWELRR